MHSAVLPFAYSADRLVRQGVRRLVREGNRLGHRQATGHRVEHLVGQRVEPSHWQAALSGCRRRCQGSRMPMSRGASLVYYSDAARCGGQTAAVR